MYKKKVLRKFTVNKVKQKMFKYKINKDKLRVMYLYSFNNLFIPSYRSKCQVPVGFLKRIS